VSNQGVTKSGASPPHLIHLCRGQLKVKEGAVVYDTLLGDRLGDGDVSLKGLHRCWLFDQLPSTVGYNNKKAQCSALTC
jgi:hypothetical protein